MISALSKDVLKNRFLNEKMVSHTKPTVYAMAGIPASGKSTFVERSQQNGDFPQDTFILNPDLVMHCLDDYHLCCLEEGAEKAFLKYDLPSRMLAYDFFDEAINRRMDIIKDMGNARFENIEKIKRLKEEGYCVKVFFVYASIDAALGRLKLRDRHTPKEMVVERAASLKELVYDLYKLSDSFYAFDNNNLKECFKPITKEKLFALLAENY